MFHPISRLKDKKKNKQDYLSKSLDHFFFFSGQKNWEKGVLDTEKAGESLKWERWEMGLPNYVCNLTQTKLTPDLSIYKTDKKKHSKSQRTELWYKTVPNFQAGPWVLCE